MIVQFQILHYICNRKYRELYHTSQAESFSVGLSDTYFLNATSSSSMHIRVQCGAGTRIVMCAGGEGVDAR